MLPLLAVLGGAAAQEAAERAVAESCPAVKRLRAVQLRGKVDDLLKNANLRAFLRVIRHGETSAANDGTAYVTVNGGGKIIAPPWRHPGGDKAAGAYQFMNSRRAPTWTEIAQDLRLEDFSPLNQDRAAVGVIAWQGMLDAVLAGDTRTAYRCLCGRWTSLPGGKEVAVYRKMVNKADGKLLAPEVAADFIFAKWGGRATGK